MIEQEQLLDNPFPGLRPFETDEYQLFFGRDGQSDEVLTKLRAARFVAVVGTSGSGKSSLVRAGLLPALFSGHMTSAGSMWRVAVFRPGSSPIHNLARALAESGAFDAGAAAGAADLEQNIERTLRRSSLGLLEVVGQSGMSPHENLLILADQFEELFRFRKKSADAHPDDEAAAFVKLLLEAKQPGRPHAERLPIYVILTMRSDYLGECAHYWGLPEAINEGQYLIPRMTDDNRREAIIGPVIMRGGKITPTLVNRLLNDAGEDPAQLPILQHALMRTWDEWRGKSPGHAAEHVGEAIDLCCYESIGGMAEALSRHANEAFLELSPEQQRVAEKLFKALTEKEADNREGRRPATVAEICAVAEADEESVKAVVEVFRREGRSFLMPPPRVPLEPDTLVDISHESLIRGWQRLRVWVDEEAQSARQYRRLAEKAADFPEKESHLRDPGLQIGLDWLAKNRPTSAWAARYHEGFDKTVEYLRASEANREEEAAAREREQKEKIEQAQALADAERRRVRTRNWMLLGLSVLLLLFATSTAVAVQQWYKVNATLQTVEEQKKIAVQERDRANEQTRIAEVAKTDAENQRANAIKAQEAAEHERNKALSAEKETARQRDAALRATVEANRQRDIAKGALADAARRRDEAETAKGTAEQQFKRATELLETVKEIDHSAPYSKAIMRGHTAAVTGAAFSPDGKTLVTAGEDKTIRFWDAASEQSTTSVPLDSPVTSVALSHDGRYVVATGEDPEDGLNIGTLTLWKGGDPSGFAKSPHDAESGALLSAVFSPDDKLVATMRYLSADVFLWTVPGLEEIPLKGHTGTVNSIAFSGDGMRLVTASDDGTARVWDTATGKVVAELRGHLSEVNSARFSRDGRLVITASNDKTARVWDVRTGETMTLLTSPGDEEVTRADFSPDGKYAVTVGGKRAYLWEGADESWKAFTPDSPNILAGHTGAVTGAAFSPDGKWVVTISEDRTAQVWSAKILPQTPGGTVFKFSFTTANSVAVLSGHIKPLTALGFSNDSRSLFTTSEDRTARVWDMTAISVFSVAGATLKAEPADYSGPCPVTIKFSGAVNGSGGSGTVKYRFVRSDGTQSLVQELTFDGPGAKEVSETRDLFFTPVSGSGSVRPRSGWVELQVLEPVEMKSNRADFNVVCAGSGSHQMAAELTDAQLGQIMPNSTAAQRALLLPHLRRAMEEFGINTPQRQAAFLAAVAWNTSDLNYLTQLGTDEDLEKRYGQRKDLGNYDAGDGTRFKGRGGFMISGRAIYSALGEGLGVDLVANPDLAATPELAFRTAALYWQRNGLNEMADKADIASIARRTGIEQSRMQQIYGRAAAALGVVSTQQSAP